MTLVLVTSIGRRNPGTEKMKKLNSFSKYWFKNSLKGTLKKPFGLQSFGIPQTMTVEEKIYVFLLLRYYRLRNIIRYIQYSSANVLTLS